MNITVVFSVQYIILYIFLQVLLFFHVIFPEISIKRAFVIDFFTPVSQWSMCTPAKLEVM